MSRAEDTNGWAPSSVMLMHGAGLHTSVRYNPLEPNRVAGARWRVRATVYGPKPLEPIWSEVSDWVEPGRSHYELTSGRLCAELGVNALEHYAEFHPYTPDAAPEREQIAAPLFAHYTSEDGSFEAHLPSAYMYGASRGYKIKSQWKYQNFPYVEVGGPFELRIYSMNQMLRKISYSVALTSSDGSERVESDLLAMRPKSLDIWRGRLFPNAQTPRAAGVVIKSDFRIPSFVGVYHRGLERMVGLDHTHPFFPA